MISIRSRRDERFISGHDTRPLRTPLDSLEDRAFELVGRTRMKSHSFVPFAFEGLEEVERTLARQLALEDPLCCRRSCESSMLQSRQRLRPFVLCSISVSLEAIAVAGSRWIPPFRDLVEDNLFVGCYNLSGVGLGLDLGYIFGGLRKYSVTLSSNCKWPSRLVLPLRHLCQRRAYKEYPYGRSPLHYLNAFSLVDPVECVEQRRTFDISSLI